MSKQRTNLEMRKKDQRESRCRPRRLPAKGKSKTIDQRKPTVCAALGVKDIGAYIRAEREKQEKVQQLLEQPHVPLVAKRGPPRQLERRKLLALLRPPSSSSSSSSSSSYDDDDDDDDDGVVTSEDPIEKTETNLHRLAPGSRRCSFVFVSFLLSFLFLFLSKLVLVGASTEFFFPAPYRVFIFVLPSFPTLLVPSESAT